VFQQWRKWGKVGVSTMEKMGKSWCFSNGENGEKLVFQRWRKWGKVGVLAMEKIGKSLCFSNREIGVSEIGKRDVAVKEK